MCVGASRPGPVSPGPGGTLCTVTHSADIIRRRVPRSKYFSETLQGELERYFATDEVHEMMRDAGVTGVSEHTVEVHHGLADVSPYRAPSFSSLKLVSAAAFERGLRRMQRDLERGPYPV